jgi:hypothetical protein
VLHGTSGFLSAGHARGVTEPKARGFNPHAITARADESKGVVLTTISH